MMGFNSLIKCIENNIKTHNFKKHKINNLFNFKDVVILRRRTHFTNRAIAIIELSDENKKNIKNLGQFSQRIKKKLGKEIGYKFIFYALGLQVVFYGHDVMELSEKLANYTDKTNNQYVVLQSIHVIDNRNNTSKSVRTWGQYITGEYQNIIEKSIEEYKNNSIL